MNFARALRYFSLFYLVFCCFEEGLITSYGLIPTKRGMWRKWYLGHVCKTFLGDEFWISLFQFAHLF